MGDFYLELHDKPDSVSKALALYRELIKTIHLPSVRGGHDDLGDLLFSLAFPDPAGWINFADELATHTRADDALRVWVPSVERELGVLPWEYLRVPNKAIGDFANVGATLHSRFLALHPHCLFVRDERSGREAPPPRPMGKLKLLIFWANPGGIWEYLPSVDLEAARVRRGVEGLGPAFIETQELPHATAVAFRQKMRSFQPHIVHFCGHGHHPDVGGPASPPAIVCGRNGLPEYLTAEDLAACFGEVGPAVVVLNCCFAGYASPFAVSFAKRLIVGLPRPPVIVAYQAPATDASAAGLAFRLYEGLRDVPIEEAVARYRRRFAAEHPLGDMAKDWVCP